MGPGQRQLDSREQPGQAYFGDSVGTAGDVNGDGYADVIVGAPNYDNGETDEGAAFIWYGARLGLSRAATGQRRLDRRRRPGGALFGTAVNIAGDVNGDGYSDVMVGAPAYDHNASGRRAGLRVPWRGRGPGRHPTGPPRATRPAPTSARRGHGRRRQRRWLRRCHRRGALVRRRPDRMRGGPTSTTARPPA